ncbi:MAG: hypothetical protein R3F24_03865 [Gammaproteobacteria bacterium]
MLIPVHSSSDILPAYRNTPVATLLRLQNLHDQPSPDSKTATSGNNQPQILLSTCFESEPEWHLPAGFAIVLRTGAASLKRDPFKVSWAVGVAGASAIAVIGHETAECLNSPAIAKPLSHE